MGFDGDYTVDVQYGLMAGLDPNRALVFGLQARGDKLISRDFLRRQMPFSFNATQEEEKVDTEDLRDAMKQAIASYAQAIPALASQGQNPSDILYKLSTVINQRQKGTPIEQAVSEAFQPQNPPPGAMMTPEGVSPELLGQAGAVPPGEGQLPYSIVGNCNSLCCSPGVLSEHPFYVSKSTAVFFPNHEIIIIPIWSYVLGLFNKDFDTQFC